MQVSQTSSQSDPKPIVSPLSCKGQWQRKLLLNKLDNAAIKDLSYAIMSKFTKKIEKDKRWGRWEGYIGREFRDLKITEKMTPGLFVKTMMERGFRIQNLVNMATKIDDLSVEKCFYKSVEYLKYTSCEVTRIRANEDTSQGLLKDISDEALKEIAHRIEGNSSWRKMGDGLGFNLFECLKFSQPLEMLEEWMARFPEGTLERVYYEAERLESNSVCEYLSAIPLNKMSPIEIRDPHASHPELRMTTTFDLEKLDALYGANGVQINWEAISRTLFKGACSKKEDIWKSGNVRLCDLNEAMNTHYKVSFACFDQFMEEVRSGTFEPVGDKGVTYNQVAYLAEAISREGYPLENLIKEQYRSEVIGTCDFRVKQLSVRSFFCLYWQLNRELDLWQFVQKIKDMSCGWPFTHLENVMNNAYEEINPKRYYSARLDEKNKKMNETYLKV